MLGVNASARRRISVDFTGHERAVIGGERLLIRHALRHTMQQRTQFALRRHFDRFEVVQAERKFGALVQEEKADGEHADRQHSCTPKRNSCGTGENGR